MNTVNVPAKFEVRIFTVRRSRASKVIDFGTNQKRIMRLTIRLS